MEPKAVSLRSGINLLFWWGPLIEQEINPIRPDWFLKQFEALLRWSLAASVLR
jgi:hypothetical protein